MNVQLEKAVAYCLENGATVSESAKKFGVNAQELSQLMSEAMNPNGAGLPEDVAKFQNTKVAHATLKVNGQSYEIVGVAIGSEKGASARIYDENGMEVNIDDFKNAYKINSFKVNNDTGEISVVVYDNAPKISVKQTGQEGNFFDTLKNLWNWGKNNVTADNGVVIIGNKNNVAQNSSKATGTTPQDGVVNVANEYGIPTKEYEAAQKTVNDRFSKMSDDEKADLAKNVEKLDVAVKSQDSDKILDAIADVVGKMFPEDFDASGFTMPKEALYACLAVLAIAAVATAAETGAVSGVSGALSKIGTAGMAKMAAAVFATAGLTSCSPDDFLPKKETNIGQYANIYITKDSGLDEAYDAILEEVKGIRNDNKVTSELLLQILENQIENGMTAKEILKLCGDNQVLLSRTLAAMTENNNLLTEVQNSINSGVKDIINALVDIKGSVGNITNLIKDFPQYSTQLNEIINGIKTGNATMSDMKALIEKLLKQANKNGDVQVNILNKLTEIENSNKSDGEKFAEMVKLLGEIKAGIDGIADGLKDHFKNDATVNSYLEKILAEAKKNNTKTDETNTLLKGLYNLVEKLGKDGDKLGKEILNYIAAVGFEMNRNFTAVLEAINKGVAGADSLRDLLEKVLEKQDKNTKDIIDAIGNIKVTGGSVDLSSIEKMLAELLKQSKANGNILSNIDAKTDVIATTTKSILAALEKEFGKNDERYKNINNILTVIANKAGGKGDDEKLLAKLDEILQKLDEIKDAIKDHKVTVDVTGKVTCECNCGKNHEGILGDLDDILG